MKFLLSLVLLCSLTIYAIPVQAMTTPILIANSNAGLSTSNSSYINLAALGADNVGGSSIKETPMAIAGTFTKLYFRLPVALSSGSYVATLYKNGSPTALTLTLDSSSGLVSIDSTHSVSVAVGDLVYVRVDPFGTPSPAPGRFQLSAVFDGTTAGESVIFTSSVNFSGSGVRYTGFGIETGVGTTDAVASTVMPTSGVIDHFYAAVPSAPGSGKSLVYTLVKNGTPTALVATISDLATTGNDTTHSVSVVAGDTLSVSCTPSGTPTSNQMNSSVRFVPTVDGESAMFGTTDSQSASATNYLYTTGYLGQATVEANQYAVAPIAFSWKKLFLNFNTAPGSGKSRTFTSRINAGNGALTAAVTDTNTTGSDTSNSVSVAAGDLLDWASIPSGTPAASSNWRYSAVMYIVPAGGGGGGGSSAPSLFQMIGGAFRVIGGKFRIY